MSKYHKTTKEERKVMRLSSSLPTIDEWDDNSAIDINELTERVTDCFSYNSSYYCNGRWCNDPERDLEIGVGIDNVGEYQVLRYYFADYTYGTKENINCADIEDDDNAWDDWFEENIIQELEHGEFAQMWIAPNGKETLLCRPLKADEYYSILLPVMSAPLQVSKRTDNVNMPYNAIYRARKWGKILPQLFKHEQSSALSYFDKGGLNFTDDSVDDIRAYLSSFGEWLSKCMPHLIEQDNISLTSLQAIERQLKIAHRHHYVINEDNLRTWYDYINMLIDCDTANNTQLSLQPFYVCPADLIREHDRLAERINRVRREVERRARAERARKSKEDFLAHHSRYLNINFTNGHLNARSLNSPQEYIEEGEKMHHCVGGYYDRPNSLIFAVEEIATGRKVATVEVNIKNLSIEQIAGVCNLGNGVGHGLLPEWNEIYDMVTANMHVVKERKTMKIKKQRILKKVA